MFIGEWAENRGIRDQLVIATKYSGHYKLNRDDIPIKINYVGNNLKNLNVSVEASLKKLRTTYIDILYIHCMFVFQESVPMIVNISCVYRVGIRYLNRRNYEWITSPCCLGESVVSRQSELLFD